MIPFMRSARNRQIYRGRKEIGGCRGREGGQRGEKLLHARAFCFEVVKCFGTGQGWWLHNTVKALNATG